MAAYVIVDMEVHDPVRIRDYIKKATPTADLYGGKMLVRAGRVETLEGDWRPSVVVVTEFASFEKAKEWWDSPEYREAREIREPLARTNLIVVDGIQPRA